MPNLTSMLTRPELGSITASLPIRAWMQVARERAQLAEMTGEQLRDVGIDPVDATREAARPFWDLPRRRR